jgi:hypothetical protein
MNNILLAIGLSAPVSSAFASAPQDDPPAAEALVTTKMDARMRIFGQKHIDVRFYRNQTCVSGKGVAASKAGGLPNIFRDVKNLSLGIPVTPPVESMKERDGFLNNAYYREFALYPGDPVVLRAAYISGPSSVAYTCHLPAVSFVPQKETDYEVQTNIGNGKCSVSVQRIEMADGKVNMVPVELTQTGECGRAR